MDDPGYYYAKIAYDGYCTQTGWKSLISGADLPKFGALPEAIKLAWKAAAWAVQQQCLGEIEDFKL